MTQYSWAGRVLFSVEPALQDLGPSHCTAGMLRGVDWTGTLKTRDRGRDGWAMGP